MTLIQDLLTENRYWTFNATDWMEFSPNGVKQRYHIFWEGKTKWATVVEQVRKAMGKNAGEEIYFERQIELKTPDLFFK